MPESLPLTSNVLPLMTAGLLPAGMDLNVHVPVAPDGTTKLILVVLLQIAAIGVRTGRSGQAQLSTTVISMV